MTAAAAGATLPGRLSSSLASPSMVHRHRSVSLWHFEGCLPPTSAFPKARVVVRARVVKKGAWAVATSPPTKLASLSEILD